MEHKWMGKYVGKSGGDNLAFEGEERHTRIPETRGQCCSVTAARSITNSVGWLSGRFEGMSVGGRMTNFAGDGGQIFIREFFFGFYFVDRPTLHWVWVLSSTFISSLKHIRKRDKNGKCDSPQLKERAREAAGAESCTCLSKRYCHRQLLRFYIPAPPWAFIWRCLVSISYQRSQRTYGIERQQMDRISPGCVNELRFVCVGKSANMMFPHGFFVSNCWTSETRKDGDDQRIRNAWIKNFLFNNCSQRKQNSAN